MSRKFDRYKDTYRIEVDKSISFIRQDVDFFTEAKARALLAVAHKELGEPARLAALDVGCGVGHTDKFLTDAFSTLDGVDVSEGALQTAASTNATARYQSYDGKTLPYRSESFDLVFAICVMHHVPRESWSSFAAEMARVTRPGGAVVVFEHNPFNPLTRLAVHRCEFDDDAVLLRVRTTREVLAGAGLRVTDSRFILFSPWRLPGFARVEERLGGVPLGAQYYVAGRKRDDEEAIGSAIAGSVAGGDAAGTPAGGARPPSGRRRGKTRE